MTDADCVCLGRLQMLGAISTFLKSKRWIKSALIQSGRWPFLAQMGEKRSTGRPPLFVAIEVGLASVVGGHGEHAGSESGEPSGYDDGEHDMISFVVQH